MNDIFTEKYRPAEFEDVVGLNPEIPKLVSSSMPHMLFIGGAGSGKTTTAKIIIRKLNADVLVLNASKDRGIGVIRDRIEPFASKASQNTKIVFLDEFDYTTPEFQTALRNLMETYAGNTRFIATCNYPNKIIDPLLSRFAQFQFKRYAPEDILKYVRNIAQKENITADDETLQLLIKKRKDDIRSMVNFLQQNKNRKIEKKDVSNEHTVMNILAMLGDGKWFELRQQLLDQQLEYGSLIEEIENTVFNVSALSIPVRSRVTVACARAQFEMAFSMNKEITFSALLYDIQNILRETTQ